MLPKAATPQGGVKQIITRDGPAIRGVYPIRFESDDGLYELEITVSREPPSD